MKLNNILFVFNNFISFISYSEIISLIDDAIRNKQKKIITYMNFYTLDYYSENPHLWGKLKDFSLIFNDGFGIWISAKFLRINYKKKTSFNFSDYSTKFLNDIIKAKYTIYFIGSTRELLNEFVRFLNSTLSELKIVGYSDGYDELNSSLVEKINQAKPDIVWVGLGSIKQDNWIIDNYNNINCNVLFAVGDVFSIITKKRFRGPIIFRKFGLEWVFRFIQNPKSYWKRYLVGIPVFVFKILFLKVKLVLKKE